MSRTYIAKELRLRISEEARYRCGYCLTQEILVGAPMEIDHLVPEALGGQTEADNLWLACSLCNDTRSLPHPDAGHSGAVRPNGLTS